MDNGFAREEIHAARSLRSWGVQSSFGEKLRRNELSAARHEADQRHRFKPSTVPGTPPLLFPAFAQPGVTLAYQGTELLERTTLRLGNGRRYGLVGANGVGKTTLLRRIAAGAVPGWPLHMRSYFVQQEEMVSDWVSSRGDN